MSLSIGIVGLPNVGKSTLFNALTGRAVPAENYPFCTIDPCVGVVPVPDERLNALSYLSTGKTIPAVVEFTDIAGLVKGASIGEGLGNKFLANIREADAIAEVVRVFKNDDIVHTAGEINPLRDVEIINLELVLADFQTVSKRRSNLEKEKRGLPARGPHTQAGGAKDACVEDVILEKVETGLDAGNLASTLDLSEEEKKAIKHLNLLTLKPILYVLNRTADDAELPEELADFFSETGAGWVSLDIALEKDISGFGDTEKTATRQEFGITDEGLDELIKKGYKLLDLITFFTTGPKETRGWTVKRGSTAPEAGAAIHSDFRDKFIRAEVINWRDLVNAGSYCAPPKSLAKAYTAAREKGLVRTEGKEYVVNDGDVIEFKI